MSFFLGQKRTASVKAKDNVRVFRIPKEHISSFLQQHPSASREITGHLAQWLDETSQIVHGLKEFCDQLPDAVILSNKQGKILTWNSAAEKLYGRNWNQMRNTSVDEIYENSNSYKDFLEEVKSRYSVREKIFTIKHSEKGKRFISVSTTVLYDGHHNFQGVLSLGRDVTAVKNLEKKYRQIGYWLIASVLLIGLLTAIVFYGYPYFSEGHRSVDIRQQDFKNSLAKDYFLLKSLLVEHIVSGNRSKTIQIMQNFFNIQRAAKIPYTGLLLLDKDKKVSSAYSTEADSNVNEMIGSSYAAIAFQGSEKSLHKVLTLYRADKDHPMGKKGVEIAFELHQNDVFLGWLVFQMDMDLLNTNYGINTEGLKEFQFENS